jgi:c-di-AMP phosphodiesterase-like protein
VEVGKMTPDDERTAFESIIQDFEMHYKNGPEMFSSRYNFDAFLNTEVRFHAKLLKVDFEKARAAVLKWVEEKHAEEYLSLT